jgi:hypothetical protein
VVPRRAVSLEGLPCVLLSPLPLQSTPLLSRAVLAFLGVRVPNLNNTAGHIPTHTAGHTPIHMTRCPDQTHMKGDTGTRTVPGNATLMEVRQTHIASCDLSGCEFTNGKRPLLYRLPWLGKLPAA